MVSSPIVRQAASVLTNSRHSALRRLKVQDAEGTLVISGEVPSWYLKQMAQEAVMPVRGALQLVNRVDVVH